METSKGCKIANNLFIELIYNILQEAMKIILVKTEKNNPPFPKSTSIIISTVSYLRDHNVIRPPTSMVRRALRSTHVRRLFYMAWSRDLRMMS